MNLQKISQWNDWFILEKNMYSSHRMKFPAKLDINIKKPNLITNHITVSNSSLWNWPISIMEKYACFPLWIRPIIQSIDHSLACLQWYKMTKQKPDGITLTIPPEYYHIFIYHGFFFISESFISNQFSNELNRGDLKLHALL